MTSRALLLLIVVGLAGGLFYFASGEDEKDPLTYAIFERAATERDRAPQDEWAGGLRTQEQTGELRFAGEFRRHRAYVGRDDSGSCLFDVKDGAGATCGPGSIAFKSLAALDRDENVAFVVVPDGMKARVYEGRPLEMRELENVVGVAFREPITLRIEGRGRRKDVRLG